MARWFDNWFQIDFKHLTRFTFDEYCPNYLALFDWRLRTYYMKPIQEALKSCSVVM